MDIDTPSSDTPASSDPARHVEEALSDIDDALSAEMDAAIATALVDGLSEPSRGVSSASTLHADSRQTII